MTEKTQLFQFAGERPAEKTEAEKKKKWYQDRPVAAELFLSLLVLGCLFCGQIMTKDPSYMDLKNCSVMPCREFLFGTDTMGRDIFSMIWYGGRISLAIGLLSTLISTVIAVLFGAVSGCAPAWLDALLMRLTEIFLSVPNLLLVIFLLAAAGKSNVITISAVSVIVCSRRHDLCGNRRTAAGGIHRQPFEYCNHMVFSRISADDDTGCGTGIENPGYLII